MEIKTTELIEILDQLILILEGDNVKHWAKWMKEARSRLLRSDYGGVEKVLSAYGGMGSFNDVCLTKITSKNQIFTELQSRAWELADAIKRHKK